MKILIPGGDGMLGHQLLKSLSTRHDVRVTLRGGLSAYAQYGLFTGQNAYDGVDVRSETKMLEVVADFRPDVIINAVGVVKQRSSAKEAIPSLEINSLWPHRLALIARAANARVIHLSTDCVYSGRKGNYSEDDAADAEDLYGRSKLLGEVAESNCFTLRTSIIGRELAHKKSLVEWFLAQRGQVRGFSRAIYTGFTTAEMARILELLIVKFPQAHGVWNVSSDPISKYDLLKLIRQRLGLAVDIVEDRDFHCDRSLDSTRFRREFGYTSPSWESMVADLDIEERK